MILDYLKERYNEHDFAPYTLEQIAESYEKLATEKGNYFFKTPKSFINFKLQGDALIVDDIYVKIEYRGTHEARRLFNSLLSLGKKAGKTVMIGFAELKGKNRNLGIAAMHIGGFLPAFQTSEAQVFVRGI